MFTGFIVIFLLCTIEWLGIYWATNLSDESTELERYEEWFYHD
ncbi:hypothetical protein [Pontibacillus litoralis]|uniref:Uncharacterized protein n=1 Tax=Pontibacillus litoralis JSM 072002 TaxID=1385512 RepID=A0A0A5G518_9BACI|nr:hypothetical protein [Pontibacillus litoralis]KGX86248.1 hypothetical protein N784_05460 [Pontibacillus litoralis JSM 072002]